MSDDSAVTEVIILTGNYRVVGKIALVPGARLTDYVSVNKNFIPIINAKVWDRVSHDIIMDVDFLNLQSKAIEIIVPSNDVNWMTEPNGLEDK